MNQEPLVQSQELFPSKVSKLERKGHIVHIECENGALLQLHVLTDDIVRVRFATEGYFPRDLSYAIDPEFKPDYPDFQIEEDEEYINIRTSSIICQLTRNGLKTTFLDLNEKVILEDDKGFHWEKYEHGGAIVMMSKKVQEDEYYFGMGDKSGHLNLRGQRIQNWNTDSFGYSSKTDPLYRSIPFYYGLHHDHGYGVFFDNSFRTFFDFGKERPEATSFWAHNGEMNYYFINGPGLIEVAENYAMLTGRPELPALWTLGYHQCKWSYYPEKEVKRIANEFRSRNIPCDAIYLDIDYMDGYRCFTWNHEFFPDPKRMIGELKDDGFKTVVMIDPGIMIDRDYWVYQQGMDMDAYLKTPNGLNSTGKVWPGPCVFPDFTREDVREWWGELYQGLISENGVAAVWNDMNEPAAFEVPTKTIPEDVRFHFEGRGGSHQEGHNIYGMQMSRASYNGLKKHLNGKRPYVITRASYSGGQRYASVWTGDNVASWEHLLLASTQSQRLSVSGFSFVGSDVGGFNDEPDGELVVRWLQMAAFHPLYRMHSIGYHAVGDAAVDEDEVQAKMDEVTLDQEPWVYGEPYTQYAREAIELRYRILPIMYTAFYQYVQRGTPVLRPMSFMYQNDPETLHRMEEFCLGDHLVAAPVAEPGLKRRGFYLPKGRWYNFKGNKAYSGGKEQFMDVDLNSIPLFVKEGAVLPIAPVMQYVGEKEFDQHELHVYAGSDEVKSQWYEDEGDGYGYTEGNYRLANFYVKGSGSGISMKQEIEGNFDPCYKEYKLFIHGIKSKKTRCLVDGELVPTLRRGKTVELTVNRDFNLVEIG
ncbi:MAG: glycoside hydrolase family 31 protein [Bacteroidia bacterium]|nr:glycoside hydrolase family 31 protein [Bacteroidia bacterium]